jgi:di/tricarboxylate transporter
MTKATWKNRRRMAWLSFGVICLIAGAGVFRLTVGDDPNTWTGIIGIVVGVLGAIVVGYTGFATWADIQEKKDGEI